MPESRQTKHGENCELSDSISHSLSDKFRANTVQSTESIRRWLLHFAANQPPS